MEAEDTSRKLEAPRRTARGRRVTDKGNEDQREKRGRNVSRTRKKRSKGINKSPKRISNRTRKKSVGQNTEAKDASRIFEEARRNKA